MPPAGEIEVEHLLLVAGPSGAGKSAFLRGLAVGILSPDVIAALPRGAPKWPQAGGNHVVHDNGGVIIDADGRLRLNGLVLHYDFMRVFESLIPDYGSDPALALVAAARQVTVVTMQPATDLLIEQIGQKAASRDRIRQIERRARRLVRRILNPGRKFIYQEQQVPGRHRRLAELYRTPGFLKDWYGRWATFIDMKVSADRLVAKVTVEPIAGFDGKQRFRVVDETTVSH